MRILIVNHYAGHTRLGMEFRPFYLASEWISKGHQVEIVASSYSHLRHTQPEMKNLKSRREIIETVPYNWLKAPRYEGNGIKRVINIFVFLFRLLRWSKKTNFKPDVIIASSTYPLDAFICHQMAKKWRARWVFEVHDLWPLSPIELGGLSPRHPFMALLQYGENFACKNANKIISILPKTKDHLVAHGMNPKNFFHIPNGIVVRDWDNPSLLPEEHQSLIKDLREKNEFLVGYAGAFGVANNMDLLLETARTTGSKIHYLLVGRGPEKKRLQQICLDKKMTWVHFLPAIAKHQVPLFLEQMDSLYVGLQPLPIYRFGIGLNKLFDYMMAAKPIVFSGKAGNRPVLESNSGFEVDSGKPEDIAEAIFKVKAMSYAERETLGKNGREFVLAHHDYNKLADQFLNHLKE